MERDDIGELILLIGENNVGKTNVLDALSVIKPLETAGFERREDAVPYFIDYSNCMQKIELVYVDDDDDKESFAIEYSLDFSDKTFHCRSRTDLVERTVTRREVRRSLDLQAIKDEFEGKFSAYNAEMREYSEKAGDDYYYSNTIYKLKNSYEELIAQAKKTGGIEFEKIEKLHSELKYTLDEFVYVYNNKYMGIAKRELPWDYSEATGRLAPVNFRDIGDVLRYREYDAQVEKKVWVPEGNAPSKIMEKYGIDIIPKVVLYKEKGIGNSELQTTPKGIYESPFFKSLLKAIGEYDGLDMPTVRNAYQMVKQNPDALDAYTDKINEKLKSISERFNRLYHGDSDQRYDFLVKFGEDKIHFAIREHGKPVLLSQQSTGFRWFFNFFFNFAYANGLQPGDIVLMDEPSAHLAIPAKRELRRFLKSFARRTGITFIAATQDADFIDPDHLDELRIVKRKKGEVGSMIQNDFSDISDDADDTLSEILDAVGVTHRNIITNPNNTVVYVEGLTDYNFLTAFKQLREEEEGKKINLVFLPINGLGKDEEQMKKRLRLPIKYWRAVIFTDSDEEARTFDSLCKADPDINDDTLTVLELADSIEGARTIEDLFSEGDKSIYNLNPENGYKGVASTLFKRKVFNLLDELKEIREPENRKGAIDKLADTRTKENFYKLLDYLMGQTAAQVKPAT